MKTIAVINRQGENCGNIEVPKVLLVTDRGNQVVQETLTAYMAAQRAGTASTKNKGAVTGSNKKPWKQKGLGRARAGYRRSPVWRGGGVAFGPNPRSYLKHVNRKAARLAFRRVLSDKISNDAVRVIDTLTLPDAKTRSMHQLLKELSLSGRVLLVAATPSAELIRATRNLPKVELVRANDLNIYQLLRYPLVLAERAAVEMILERLQDKAVTEQ